MLPLARTGWRKRFAEKLEALDAECARPVTPIEKQIEVLLGADPIAVCRRRSVQLAELFAQDLGMRLVLELVFQRGLECVGGYAGMSQKSLRDAIGLPEPDRRGQLAAGVAVMMS